MRIRPHLCIAMIRVYVFAECCHVYLRAVTRLDASQALCVKLLVEAGIDSASSAVLSSKDVTPAALLSLEQLILLSFSRPEGVESGKVEDEEEGEDDGAAPAVDADAPLFFFDTHGEVAPPELDEENEQ